MTDAATPRHEVRTRRRRSQTVCMADCQTSRRALPSSRRLLSRRSHSGGVGATCRQCGRNCVDISLQKPVGKHPVPNGRRGCELPLNGEPLAPSQTETVQLRCRLGSNRHGHVSRSEDGPVEGPSWGLSRRRRTALLQSRSLLPAPLRAFPQVGHLRSPAARSSVYLRDQRNHLHENWSKSRCPWLSRGARGLRPLLGSTCHEPLRSTGWWA